jgi:hypothetical protein
VPRIDRKTAAVAADEDLGAPNLDAEIEAVRAAVQSYKNAQAEAARARADAERASEAVQAAKDARDVVLRQARAAGMPYRQLEDVSGYRRAWLERVIHNRPPQRRNTNT